MVLWVASLLTKLDHIGVPIQVLAPPWKKEYELVINIKIWPVGNISLEKSGPSILNLVIKGPAC